MRIVEQTRDRLVIEDRKTVPIPMLACAAVVFAVTMPLLFSGAWKAFVVVGVIWAMTAAVWIGIIRFSRAPTIELEKTTNRARIENLKYDLSDISHVSTTASSKYAGLTFYLRIHTTGRGEPRTDFSSVAASTPAERVRIAKIINAFLGVDSSDDDTPRWARAWDAESTATRKCFFCSTRNGDGGPLELWARRGEDLELLFVPRCGLCRRIHDWRMRLMPLVAVFGGLIAGFILAAWINRDVLMIIIGTPVAALLLGFVATWPSLYGSKARAAWRQIAEFEQACRDGWNLTVRRTTF